MSKLDSGEILKELKAKKYLNFEKILKSLDFTEIADSKYFRLTNIIKKPTCS